MQPGVLSKVPKQFWSDLAQDWPSRTDDTTIMPHAWWWGTGNVGKNHLMGMEGSIAYIRDVLARDQF